VETSHTLMEHKIFPPIANIIILASRVVMCAFPKTAPCPQSFDAQALPIYCYGRVFLALTTHL